MANVSILSRKTFKTSNVVRRSMRVSFITQRTLEKKSLEERKKLIRLRRETFRALLSSSKTKDKKNKNLSGILGGALGLRGLRSITRRRGGGGGPGIITPRRTPKFPGGANRFTGGGLLRNLGKSYDITHKSKEISRNHRKPKRKHRKSREIIRDHWKSYEIEGNRKKS